MPRSKYFRSTSRYGRISFSLMNDQMTRVISSPSSSTSGVFTSIFAIGAPPYPQGMGRPGNVQLARLFGIRVGADYTWFAVLFLAIFFAREQFAELTDEPDSTVFLAA